MENGHYVYEQAESPLKESINLFENMPFDTSILDATTAHGARVAGTMVLQLSLIVVPIVLVYYFVLAMVRSEAFPLPELFRIGILLFCIVFYKPVIGLPTTLINYANQVVRSKLTSIEDKLLYQQFLAKTLEGQPMQEIGKAGEKATKTPKRPHKRSITDYLLAPIKILVVTLPALLVGQATNLFTALAKVIVFLLSKTTAQVFYMLGPYAFLMAMLPGKGMSLLSGWFDLYKTLLFMPTVLAFLDYMIIGMMKLNMHVLDAPWNTLSNTGFNIIIVLLYCLSFWMASKVIGKAEVGGKILSIATAAASLATGSMPNVRASFQKAMGRFANSDNSAADAIPQDTIKTHA